jgi:hypothetical protein
MNPLTIAALAAAALLACGTAQAAQSFGAPMPAGEPLALSAALSDPEAFGEPSRKFTGRVTQVCQNKGCWLMLEDDGQVARVKVHDHAFALPKDASGRAVVFGELGVTELDQATAEHLAHDAADGKPVESREFRITAYSVVLEDA